MRNFRLAIITLVLALGVAMLLVRGVTAQDAPYPAPGFPAKVWINSKPLTMADLSGKVVLVDFWEYTCINCIRTFPYLRRWNSLYGPLGLVIIGVHTPEFDFARNPDLVKSAVQRFGLTFPIVVDSDRTVWDAWHNDAWPSDYLVNAKGDVVYDHVGEGDYAAMEARIQTLLHQANPKLDFTQVKYKIPPDNPEFGGVCHRATPETYLGFERSDRFGSPMGYRQRETASYSFPKELTVDYYALKGSWLAMPEYVQPMAALGALELHYAAKSVYLVAGSDAAQGAKLFVEQDGHPLASNARGVDVKQDTDGRTYIELGKKRMYYVVANPDFGQHTLALIAAAPNLSLYSFTFGNDCETTFAHK